MPRRSQDQIAADCGLAPGQKPTALQICQSKEISKQREASASTSKSQPPKLPKLKVPQSTATASTSKSQPPKLPKVQVPQSTATTVASHSNLTVGSSSFKPPLKPKSKVVKNQINLEEIEVKDPVNGPRFDLNDLDHLLNLMSMQENQDCLFGSGSITAVDGTSRTGCWETLAALMNVYHNDRHKKSSANANNKMRLTGEEMSKRWRRIKDKYLDTKRYFDKSTGTGLLDKDIAKGLDTAEKKKEYMCPRYDVIHEIFGHKANVTPHAILDTARPTQISIPTLDQINEDVVIDPTLDAEYHYKSNDFEIQPEYHHEYPHQSPPPRRTTVNLKDNIDDMASSQVLGIQLQSTTPGSKQLSPAHDSDLRYSTPDLPNPISPTPDLPNPISPTPDLPDPLSPTPDLPDPISANEDGAQSIRKATRTATKRKRGAESVANRPMKPLPLVDPNPGRHKAPAATIVKDRDQKCFDFFDKKTEEKKKAGSDLIEAQGKIAGDALKWDKEKYQNECKQAEKAESSKAKIASELADKNINWEREKFNKEDSRLVKAEEARVEAERIKTRREVMESCQLKNMSVQEMKAYMDLLFEK
ncbi:uncharacterized protein MELLADRAFT_89469 [Melampsora larici-populina 98AG31]|uniref:Uncharacterized protein n=1 Tax=Melampsora larici-populina (strain 98AG31 / pathotype 3-4-7) TaxID=747676 RepID=F4RTH2_MELLP|nr:uncharacterized protein MELLADRAFT_89469 [Melampsora larici-populina 98AG31]EGG04254.1 hypothetical protein MELLADRAFT_89469 [Melampsora larici-populina 98AG31]